MRPSIKVVVADQNGVTQIRTLTSSVRVKNKVWALCLERGCGAVSLSTNLTFKLNDLPRCPLCGSSDLEETKKP